MFDRLKKVLAVIAAILLYVVSLVPESLWYYVAQSAKTVLAHPVRATLAAAATVILLYALKDEVLDLLGIYTTRRLGHKVQNWVINSYKQPLLSSKIDKNGFSITIQKDQRVLIISKDARRPMLKIYSEAGSGDDNKAILAAATPHERLALKETIFLEVARTDLDDITVSDEGNVLRVVLSSDVILDKNFDELRMAKAIQAVDKAQVLAERLYGIWKRGRTKSTEEVKTLEG